MKTRTIQMLILWSDGTWTDGHLVKIDVHTPEHWLEAKGREAVSKDPYFEKAVRSYLTDGNPEEVENANV